MIAEFRANLLENFPELLEAKILLAVSGGLDSVMLTYLMQQAGLDISIAHCNFKLRAEESDLDAHFVDDLANSLKTPLYSKEFNTSEIASEEKTSIQITARNIRYRWFEQLKDQEGFDYLVTAHHLDDSLETFMINFSRGTGIDGLLGIPAKQNWVRRPLLPFSRKQIEQCAVQHEIEWREDSSNASDKYVRNKIRHQIIPKLKEINPSLAQSFEMTLGHLTHTKELADAYIENQKSKLSHIHKTHKDLRIFDLNQILSIPSLEPLLYGLFNPYGFHNTLDLLNLCEAQSGKFLENSKFRLVKDRQTLILQDKSKTKPTSIPKIEYDAPKQENALQIEIPKYLLNADLTVRKWQNGDYFYPAGFHGKKKLSAYFRDEKLSIIEKERVWILCCGDDLVWVIGLRRDKRYIGESKDKNIRRITIHL